MTTIFRLLNIPLFNLVFSLFKGYHDEKLGTTEQEGDVGEGGGGRAPQC